VLIIDAILPLVRPRIPIFLTKARLNSLVLRATFLMICRPASSSEIDKESSKSFTRSFYKLFEQINRSWRFVKLYTRTVMASFSFRRSLDVRCHPPAKLIKRITERMTPDLWSRGRRPLVYEVYEAQIKLYEPDPSIRLVYLG
jgi:hypothetical protein